MLESLERTRREGERLAALRARHDFAELRRRLLREFGTVVGPPLRALGFEGRIPHLFRQRGRAVDLLMLQVDPYGGGFTVNLGRATAVEGTAPRAMRLASLPMGERARLTLDPTGLEDRWFRYDGPDGKPEAQQDQSLRTVVALLEHADAWLRTARAQAHIRGS